jgi:hypothetical protein
LILVTKAKVNNTRVFTTMLCGKNLTRDLWPWKSIRFQILLRTKYVLSLVKIHWRMLILECSQGWYVVKIWPVDLDLWPWKSIGFQILLRTKYVPSKIIIRFYKIWTEASLWSKYSFSPIDIHIFHFWFVKEYRAWWMPWSSLSQIYSIILQGFYFFLVLRDLLCIIYKIKFFYRKKRYSVATLKPRNKCNNQLCNISLNLNMVRYLRNRPVVLMKTWLKIWLISTNDWPTHTNFKPKWVTWYIHSP